MESLDGTPRSSGRERARVAVARTWHLLRGDHGARPPVVLPATLGIDSNDLEENDYFLTWERGESAVRYCHFVNTVEVTRLLHDTGLTLKKSFVTDGRNHHLNSYLIFSGPE